MANMCIQKDFPHLEKFGMTRVEAATVIASVYPEGSTQGESNQMMFDALNRAAARRTCALPLVTRSSTRLSLSLSLSRLSLPQPLSLSLFLGHYALPL